MKKRVLVVEDNEDLIDLIKRVLDLLGYEVLVALDGVEAVRSATSLHPDLIIMDMLMPKMNGFQAAVELRRHPTTKAIPILAVSALTGTENRDKCFASGCDDYVVKPFAIKELADAIGRLLQEHPRVSFPIY
jgi:two-component system cell cycle response regulator DivK